MNPNLERFKRRRVVVVADGKTFVVIELPTAADMVAIQADADYAFRMIVECVFEEDGVTPAFSVEDIPDIKAHASVFAMVPLMSAVREVNGNDRSTEVKNSEAAPSGG